MAFGVVTKSSFIEGNRISSFNSHRNIDDTNPLAMPSGQLLYNMNLEYKASGNQIYLKTRRGSELIYDTGSAVVGFADYVYNYNTKFFTYVNSSGELRTVDSNNDDVLVQSGLTPDRDHIYTMFGAGKNAALFGSNREDGYYKITGAAPTFTAIADTPKMDWIWFSPISGRNFGIFENTLYWSEVQATVDNTANLEDFGYSAGVWDNSTPISPDEGIGFVCGIEQNQANWLFKDTGIWILPNPEEDPTADWFFPKADADVGTLSPKTVKRARYGQEEGIIYLGADKTLRFFTAQITRNSGKKPTISGGSSRVISEPFQTVLDQIPDDFMGKCSASYIDRYYQLNIVGEFADDISISILIDTEKIIEESSVNIPQPFWFYLSNLECSFTVTRDSKLYNMHARGYISKLWVASKRNDEVPERIDDSESLAIPWSGILGWTKFSSTELELVGTYVDWAVEGAWPAVFHVNSFTNGEAIPDFNDTLEVVIDPQQAGTAYYDISQFDISRFGSEKGAASQQALNNTKGNWFLFGLSNDTKDQPASIYGFTPVFRPTTASPTVQQ